MMGRASADPFAAVEDLNILGCFSDPAEPKKHLKQTVRCKNIRHKVLFITVFFEGHGWRHTGAGQR